MADAVKAEILNARPQTGAVKDSESAIEMLSLPAI
jgi:hypothetical protein